MSPRSYSIGILSLLLVLGLSTSCLGNTAIFNPSGFTVLNTAGPLALGIRDDGYLFGLGMGDSAQSYIIKEMKLGPFSTKVKMKSGESSARFSSGLRLNGDGMTPWLILEMRRSDFFPISRSSDIVYGVWRDDFLIVSKSSVRLPLALLSVGYKYESLATSRWHHLDGVAHLNTPLFNFRIRYGSDLWYLGTLVKAFDSLGEYGFAVGVGKTDGWVFVIDLDVFEKMRINPIFWINLQDGSVGYTVVLSGGIGLNLSAWISSKEAFMALEW